MEENKQLFTIYWIENNFDVIEMNERQLKRYFSDNLKDFELNIIRIKPEDDIDKYLSNSKHVDIIVTDFKLTKKINGLDIIKRIKRKKLLTDVLFYTAGKFKLKTDEIHKKTGYYGFLIISEGTKDVYGDVIKLIGKNLRRCNDIIFLRGLVISRIIDIEIKMNGCFETHFKIPKNRLSEFRNFMLENRFNPFSGKLKTISKILKKHKLESDFKGLKTKIEDLEKERNLIAHCKVDYKDNNVLISMGDEERFDRKRILKILNKAYEVDEQIDKLTDKLKLFS